MSELRPATRADILSALTYGLRFDRQGKPTRRHSELMAQVTADAFADMLEASNMVLMMETASRAGRRTRRAYRRNGKAEVTAEEAKLLNDRITAAKGYIMWFVAGDSTGMFTARAMIADADGGHQEGDDLVAGTLDALRAMLPAGLTRRDRTMMMRPEVVEMWD